MVQKSYQRIARILSPVECDRAKASALQEKSEIVSKMKEFILDDLNTPGMLGILFENLDTIKSNSDELCAVKLFLQDVLGMSCEPLPEEEVVITPEIQQLLEEREAARAAKDFKRADTIRDQLKAKGFEVQDKKVK